MTLFCLTHLNEKLVMHQEIAPKCDQQPSQTGHGACDIGITAGVGCGGGNTGWLRTSTGRSLTTTGEPTMKDPRYGNLPPDNAEQFKYVLTREDVEKVLTYTHIYPNLHGYTQNFFAKNYPNESLASFMTVFKSAGILTKRDTYCPGGRCKNRFHTIFFTDQYTFYVQWQ
jgi:hypothetical protein